MARPANTPTLFQEVQLSPAPASPSSILTINTTGNNSQAVTLFGAGRKRGYNEISELDEESYARKYLASEASVFFRRKNRFPRSFLWRVLNDRRLLEVQCVDLVKERSDSQHAGSLTYHIELPTDIVRGGVAFADPKETDALEIFVLTKSSDLFTITLKRDLLTRDEPPAGFDSSTLVKKYSPSSFGFRYPYRMVAVSNLELLVSLHDGCLLRLERQPNEGATQWRETFYSEGGWSGTLKGLNPLKRRQAVRYGDVDLDTNSAVDLAKSRDGNIVWTVTLDHYLKAWSVNTGKVALQMDLSNERADRDESKRQPRYVMTPEQGKLLQIVKAPENSENGSVVHMEEDGRYFVWVHSPKDHQFKIYEVSSTQLSAGGETLRCEDHQPRARLIPPVEEMLNANIWHLEEFHVQPSPDWSETQLWIRARTGALCKTFTITFDPLEEDHEELTRTFQSGWTVVDSGPLTSEHLRDANDFPALLPANADSPLTPTERWISFLFSPGRFSAASIEAALDTYCKRRKLSKASSKALSTSLAPLQDRLVASVTSKIALAHSADDQPNYDQYQSDAYAQWSGFYSILEDLHKRRTESVNLSFDHEQSLPWSVSADAVAPLRANDGLELLCLNTALLEGDSPQKPNPEIVKDIYSPQDQYAVPVAVLIAAAHDFRKALSPEAQDIFKHVAYQDALSDDEDDVAYLQGLYEKADLGVEVSEEVFSDLEVNVTELQGLGSIDHQVFLQIFKRLDNTKPTASHKPSLDSCTFGDRFNVAVAQQSLRQNETILLDLLALVAFMAGDLEPSELHPDFAPRKVYNEIIKLLRQTALRLWLVNNTRMEPPQSPGTEAVQVTLLESFFAGDWKRNAVTDDEAEMPLLLTRWSKRWAFAVDLNKDWSGATCHIFSMLLQSELYDLAADFVKFMPTTPWSTYMEARLAVAQGEYDTAAAAFREAAEGLAPPEKLPKGIPDTAGLLDADELNHFRAGLSLYYQHVAAIFQKPAMYSYVADFAAEAMKHVHGAASLDADLARIDGKKSNADSPAIDKINNTMDEIRLIKIRDIRSDIASRLFSALVKTGRFREAYDALRKCNGELLKANLKLLIETCIKQDCVPALLTLPFISEHVADADAILLGMAKRSLASASSAAKPHHQILYAFRSQRGDFRGAAEILYEHLERLRHSESRRYQDPEDETLLQAYLLLINTLACCGEGEGWLLAEPVPDVHQAGQKRKLVTLDEVRRDYSAELDRRSEILQGRFPLVGGGVGADEMDVF